MASAVDPDAVPSVDWRARLWLELSRAYAQQRDWIGSLGALRTGTGIVPDALADEVAAPAGCATATVMAALERAIAVDPEAVVRGWRAVSGVHNYEPRHPEQAVAFLATSSRPWADLVEEPVALDRVGSVLTGELGGRGHRCAPGATRLAPHDRVRRCDPCRPSWLGAAPGA